MWKRIFSLERRKTRRCKPVDQFGKLLKELTDGAHQSIRKRNLEQFCDEFFAASPTTPLTPMDVVQFMTSSSALDKLVEIEAANDYLFHDRGEILRLKYSTLEELVCER